MTAASLQGGRGGSAARAGRGDLARQEAAGSVYDW